MFNSNIIYFLEIHFVFSGAYCDIMIFHGLEDIANMDFWRYEVISIMRLCNLNFSNLFVKYDQLEYFQFIRLKMIYLIYLNLSWNYFWICSGINLSVNRRNVLANHLSHLQKWERYATL